MAKYLRFIILTLAAGLLFAGCAKQPPPAPPPPDQVHQMENPNALIDQMSLALTDIDAKVKANKLADAKNSAENLVKLDEQLAPHFTDTTFRDNLHHNVLGLRLELNKPTPSRDSLANFIQTSQEALKTAPGKIMTK